MVLASLVSRSIDDPDVRSLLASLGNPQPDEDEDGDVTFRMPEAGVEVLSQDGRVARIDLFGDTWDGISAYDGPLPFGVKFGESLDELRERLPYPDERGTDEGCPYLRFDVDERVIHLQFDEEDETLDLVCIASVEHGVSLAEGAFWEALFAMKPEFGIAGSQESAPDDDTLDEVATRLGVTLPPSYRALVARYAALSILADEDLWPAPKLGDVGPAWRFCRGFDVYSPGDDVPEMLDLELATIAFREGTGLDWVPFAALDGSADRYCFKRDGTIVEWSHELGPQDQDEGPVAPNVFRLLISIITDLRDSMERIRAERG